MTWFNNFNLRNKFFAVAGFCAIFFLLLSAVGLWGTSQIHNIVDGLNNDQIPEVLNINQAAIQFHATESDGHLALLENDPARIEKIINDMKEESTIVEDNLHKYLTATHPADEADTVKTLQIELDKWAVHIELIMKLARENTPASKQQALALEDQVGHDNLENVIAEITQINSEESASSKEEATNTYVTVIIIFVSFSVVVILLTLVMVFFMARALSKPLHILRKSMNALAEGDLTQKVDTLHRDEVGELGQTYNTTLDSLRTLVDQLHTQSHQVSTATYQLSVQARNQVTGSNQQASAISQIAQAIQELNQTAENIALRATEASIANENSLKQASLVSEVTDKMVQMQELGRENVAQTIETIFKLKEQVGAIEEHHRELVQQSDVIQRVIGMIDNISHETHLLALNAAIEAAGAGQFGERFSVVAGEVKRLANNAVEATREIRKSLEGISRAVERSNQSAIAGVEQAEKATTEATQSDTTLMHLSELSAQVKVATSTIVSHIEESAILATGIGIATQQQQIASQQVLQTMVSIEAVTAQNLSSIQQGDIATQQLSAAARELERSANVFKLAA